MQHTWIIPDKSNNIHTKGNLEHSHTRVLNQYTSTYMKVDSLNSSLNSNLCQRDQLEPNLHLIIQMQESARSIQAVLTPTYPQKAILTVHCISFYTHRQG